MVTAASAIYDGQVVVRVGDTNSIKSVRFELDKLVVATDDICGHSS